MGATVLKCLICKVAEANHCHHVIPRANGGLNGPTVMLCGSCHTNLHSTAKAVLCNSKKAKSYFSMEQLINAQHYIRAIIESDGNKFAGKTYTLSIVLSEKEHRDLLNKKGRKSLQDFCRDSILRSVYE